MVDHLTNIKSLDIVNVVNNHKCSNRNDDKNNSNHDNIYNISIINKQHLLSCSESKHYRTHLLSVLFVSFVCTFYL